jgi:hypothetical protein
VLGPLEGMDGRSDVVRASDELCSAAARAILPLRIDCHRIALGQGELHKDVELLPGKKLSNRRSRTGCSTRISSSAGSRALMSPVISAGCYGIAC